MSHKSDDKHIGLVPRKLLQDLHMFDPRHLSIFKHQLQKALPTNETEEFIANRIFVHCSPVSPIPDPFHSLQLLGLSQEQQKDEGYREELTSSYIVSMEFLLVSWLHSVKPPMNQQYVPRWHQHG